MPPAKWTYDNIAYMKKQLQVARLRASTGSASSRPASPSYYRWNQWLFLRMLEKGLVYKKTGVVNWDPVDQTVLANEQVIDGRGWRTGALVEKREIPMYYIAITHYADELLAALDDAARLARAREAMQANWIGKSHGVRFAFPVRARRQAGEARGSSPRAPTHHGRHLLRGRRRASARGRTPREDNPELAAFVEECKRGSVMEADLAHDGEERHADGLFVDASAHRREASTVWVGNYVLMGYGEGAVMGVPATTSATSSSRRKYGLPIKPVIRRRGRRQLDPPLAAAVRRVRRVHQLRASTTASTTSRRSTRSPRT